MSITKRLLRILKSNINSTFDQFHKRDEFWEEAEKELERELHGDEFWEEETRDYDDYTEGKSNWFKSPFRDKHIAQCYSRLEVPYGSDLKTVKKSYRRLMKKYHPDFYVNKSPEKARVAKELSQKITIAYRDLEDYLRDKEEKN